LGVTATVIVGFTGRDCATVAGATVFGTVGTLVAGTSGLVGFGAHLATDDAVVMDGGLVAVVVDGAMALFGCTCRRRVDVVDGADCGITTSTTSANNTTLLQ